MNGVSGLSADPRFNHVPSPGDMSGRTDSSDDELSADPYFNHVHPRTQEPSPVVSRWVPVGFGQTNPPGSRQRWTLYDACEEEEFAKKGEAWLSEMEQKLGVDLVEGESVVDTLRWTVQDLRMAYAEADRECTLARRAFTQASTLRTTVSELAKQSEDWENVSVKLVQWVDETRGLMGSAHTARDDIKGQMYAFQRRVGHLVPLTQTPACSICMTEPIASVAIPCGHTYCSGCASKMSFHGSCYTCRTPVTSTNRVVL